MPQGSVLGPLLFAIYCDDLPSCAESEGENIEMFADDTTLYCISNTVDEVAELLNTVLTWIGDWSHKNGMTVHPGKSEAMIIKRGTFIGPLPPLLNDFYWKVVYPAVTYGIVIWENCNATQFKALEKMHARAARIVHGLDWNLQTEQVLAKTNWTTLESTYKLRLLCLAHKYYNGQATKQICEAMIMKPRSHHYNLRDQITTTRPTTNYLLKWQIGYSMELLATICH